MAPKALKLLIRGPYYPQLLILSITFYFYQVLVSKNCIDSRNTKMLGNPNISAEFLLQGMKIYSWPIGETYNKKLKEIFWDTLEEKNGKVIMGPNLNFNFFEYLQIGERRRAFTSMFLQEPYIHAGIEKYSTDDINEADLYYIPFYFGFFFEICRLFDNIRKTTGGSESYHLCHEDPFEKILGEIVQSQQWKRAQGSDFVFTCPYNECFSGKKFEVMSNSIIIGLENSNQHKIQKMISSFNVKRYGGNDYSGKRLFKKFITIPMCVNQPNWFVQKSLRKSAPSFERNIFLYFAGRRGSSKVLRDRLAEGLKDKPGAKFILLWKDDNSNSASHEDNIKYSLQSTFCLCPHGSAPVNRRLYESIVAGCIPVILSDLQSLPFEYILGDYSKFTVNIPEATAPHKIWKILKSYSKEEIALMQKRLDELSFYFTFHENAANDPSALNLILPELGLFAADIRRKKLEKRREDIFLSQNAKKAWADMQEGTPHKNKKGSG